jgi:hypothetical protein
MENPQTGPDPAVMAAIERGNKVVFFDVSLGGGSGDPDAEDKSKPLGRIKMELFVKDVSFVCMIFVGNGPLSSNS